MGRPTSAVVTSPKNVHQKTVRLLHVLLAALTISACTATSIAVARPRNAPTLPLTAGCAGRQANADIDWHVGDKTETRELSRWCRAVGAPVEHFVLLVQELYRRGDDVPAFDARDRSAFAIKARDPRSPDIGDHARDLGLSIYYVPAMRNGPELREDRGNAIISTEPLIEPFALELPLARQRRVTLGAAITIHTADGPRQLQLVDAHLEPLSSPKTLWFFKNPRVAQVRAILELLDAPRFTDRSRTAGVVLGGDFNTIRSGAGEAAIHLARAWSNGPAHEDTRDTHMMGRLDYLFFNLGDGWSASTRRLDERFGSDHYPVVGTFSR